MLELLPSFEPHRGGTPAARTSLSKAKRGVGRQFVSEDPRRSTDATNHLAATPATQSGRSVPPADPQSRRFPENLDLGPVRIPAAERHIVLAGPEVLYVGGRDAGRGQVATQGRHVVRRGETEPDVEARRQRLMRVGRN